MAYVIAARGVSSALIQGLRHVADHGELEESRAGPVLVSPGPVVTVTHHPRQRVLRSRTRDANPFFHLIESLWMLAGRDDAATLNHYVRDFGSRFAEAGGEVHGAYGARWRRALGHDQLDRVVETLKKDPTSRQCVIQMWDARPPTALRDASKRLEETGSDDLRGAWKDRPCNTHVYLRVRRVPTIRGGDATYDDVLDLTVCCRSNDLIWGAHGANAVHFSVLQEYLAARIGVGVGVMYQVSNNYHVYASELGRLYNRGPDSLIKMTDEDWRFTRNAASFCCRALSELLALEEPTRYPTVRPMFDRPDMIDEDLRTFFRWHDEWHHGAPIGSFNNSWFEEVATRAVRSMIYYRSGEHDLALKMARDVEACDWREACVEWLERRRKK